jgi:hypothetical protein
MLKGLHSVCEGCPVIQIIEADLCAIGSVSIGAHEIAAMSDVVVGQLWTAQTIDESAARIACRDVQKDLPPPPSPMPALGHPDRIAYGRMCLAYLAIKKGPGLSPP